VICTGDRKFREISHPFKIKAKDPMGNFSLKFGTESWKIYVVQLHMLGTKKAI